MGGVVRVASEVTQRGWSPSEVTAAVGQVLDEASSHASSLLLDFLIAHADQYDAVELELANLQGGIDQCLQAQQADMVVEYLGPIGNFLHDRGYWNLARQYLPQGIVASQAVGNPWREALLCHNLGVILS